MGVRRSTLSDNKKTQYELNRDLLSRRDVTVSMVMRVQKAAVQEALEALLRLETAADEDLKSTSISKQMRRVMEDYRRGLTVLRKEVDGTPYFSEKSNWVAPVYSAISVMAKGKIIEDLDSKFVLDVQIAMFAISLNWWLNKDEIRY
jgi:soluble cytochrome b562